MTGRDPEEAHRAATPLELFLDLCFVVAVAAAAAQLHHAIAEDHVGSGLLNYAIVFFGIWWAWVNYSWFASAYDSDDVVFRLGTFVIMAGVLTLAAGIPRAFADEHDFRVLVAGYVIMRLALVPLWLRAAREDPARRFAARRYAVAILVVQALWVVRTWVFAHGAFGWVLFAALVVAELAVPFFAERAPAPSGSGRGHETTSTPWHRHHIAERYELFTIIVLGEGLLATTQAITASLDEHGLGAELAMAIAGGLLMVFSLWWLYFKLPLVSCLREETTFLFGYGHYFVFSSLAAVGASLAAIIDVIEHEAHGLESRTALLLLAGAVSVYLLSLGSIHLLSGLRWHALASPALFAVLLVGIGLLSPGTGVGVLLMGVALVVAVAWSNLRARPGG